MALKYLCIYAKIIYKDILLEIVLLMCYFIGLLPMLIFKKITKNRFLILKEDFDSSNELLEKIKIDGF